MLTHFVSPSVILVVPDGIDSLRNDRKLVHLQSDRFDISIANEEEKEFREALSLNALVLFVVNYITSRHVSSKSRVEENGNNRSNRLFILRTYESLNFRVLRRIVKQALASLYTISRGYIARYINPSMARITQESTTKVFYDRCFYDRSSSICLLQRIILLLVFESLLVTFRENFTDSLNFKW